MTAVVKMSIIRKQTSCFEDIIKTYELDKRSSSGRGLPKLIPAHMNPVAFQKMKYSYANI